MNDLDIKDITDGKIRELNEQLINAQRSSEADWQKIKNEAENQRRNWALASLALPLIQYETIILPILGSAFAGLAYSVKRRKNKT